MEQIEVNKAYIDNLKSNLEFNKLHIKANQSLVDSQERIATALEKLVVILGDKK